MMSGLSASAMEFCDIALEQRCLLVLNEHIRTHLVAALPPRTHSPGRLTVFPTLGPKVSHTLHSLLSKNCALSTLLTWSLHQQFHFSATNVHLRYLSLKKSSTDPKCEPGTHYPDWQPRRNESTTANPPRCLKLAMCELWGIPEKVEQLNQLNLINRMRFFDSLLLNSCGHCWGRICSP